MQYNHDDRQRRTDLEIIEAEDGGEILADGGTEEEDTDRPIATVEAFVEPTHVDIEVTAIEGNVKFGTPYSPTNFAIFFTPDQVETLAKELEEAAERARGFEPPAPETPTEA